MGLFTDFWDRFDFDHVVLDFSGPTSSKEWDPSRALGIFKDFGLGKRPGKAPEAVRGVVNAKGYSSTGFPGYDQKGRLKPMQLRSTPELQSGKSNRAGAVGAAASVVQAMAVSSNKVAVIAALHNDIELHLGARIERDCPGWALGGVLVTYYVIHANAPHGQSTLTYQRPATVLSTGLNWRDAYNKFNPPQPTISATKGKPVPAWKLESDVRKTWGKYAKRLQGFGWVTRAY